MREVLADENENGTFHQFMISEKLKSISLAIIGVLSLSLSKAIAKQLDSNIPKAMIVFVVISGFRLLLFIPILIKESKALSRINNITLRII